MTSTSDDPVTQAILDVVKKIEDQTSQHGWDLPPMLFLLERAPRGEVPPGLLPPGVDPLFTLSVTDSGLPDSVWEVNPPWRTLSALALLVDSGADTPLTRTDLYGLAWCFEAWAVTADDEADLERKAAQPRGWIAARSDRREVRCVIAVDVAGTRYTVFHERDGRREVTAIEPGLPTKERFEGSALDALEYLLDAVVAARAV